jgi:hypothetical protein
MLVVKALAAELYDGSRTEANLLKYSAVCSVAVFQVLVCSSAARLANP